MTPEIYVLITIADVRTNLYREVVEEVKKYFGDHLFETVIHRNIALAEATSHGVPVIEYEPSSSGAQSYLNLAKEVIKLEEKSLERGFSEGIDFKKGINPGHHQRYRRTRRRGERGKVFI